MRDAHTRTPDLLLERANGRRQGRARLGGDDDRTGPVNDHGKCAMIMGFRPFSRCFVLCFASTASLHTTPHPISLSLSIALPVCWARCHWFRSVLQAEWILFVSFLAVAAPSGSTLAGCCDQPLYLLRFPSLLLSQRPLPMEKRSVHIAGAAGAAADRATEKPVRPSLSRSGGGGWVGWVREVVGVGNRVAVETSVCG